MTDLRTLAQAVVDAHAASDHDMIVEAYDALYQGLGAPYDGDTSKRILAALDAERAQGYARAMGEVDSLLQQRVQAHRDAMLDRMPQYAHDIRQGAREEATEIREWLSRRLLAEARIERVGAILSDEGCDCYCDCDSDGHNADCDLCLACRIDREVSP